MIIRVARDKYVLDELASSVMCGFNCMTGESLDIEQKDSERIVYRWSVVSLCTYAEPKHNFKDIRISDSKDDLRTHRSVV